RQSRRPSGPHERTPRRADRRGEGAVARTRARRVVSSRNRKTGARCGGFARPSNRGLVHGYLTRGLQPRAIVKDSAYRAADRVRIMNISAAEIEQCKRTDRGELMRIEGEAGPAARKRFKTVLLAAFAATTLSAPPLLAQRSEERRVGT